MIDKNKNDCAFCMNGQCAERVKDMEPKFQVLVEEMIIAGDGRLLVETVAANTVSLRLNTDRLVRIEMTRLDSSKTGPNKICYFEDTLKHQAREAGFDPDLVIPEPVNALSRKIEALGYTYEHIARSESREEVYGARLVLNHIRFTCGGELSCRLGDNLVQVDLTYEVERVSIPVFEPIGPTGFGC